MPEPESLMPEQDKSLGARTAEAQDEQAAAHAVRDMFTAIAPRYDLLNHVLSLNTDRYWWWRASRSFRHILRCPGAAVLDLCCGTGDMSLALYRSAAPGVKIVGADFSPAMLERARNKSAGLPVEWVEADALDMPFPAGSFALVVSAFGFRNLANYDRGLDEICRVLKSGGEIGIFAEESVARMYGFGAVFAGRVEDAVHTQIAFARERWADVFSLIGHAHVLGRAVGIRIDRHRSDAHLARGAHDANGNLAAIGNQDLAEHEAEL